MLARVCLLGFGAALWAVSCGGKAQTSNFDRRGRGDLVAEVDASPPAGGAGGGSQGGAGAGGEPSRAGMAGRAPYEDPGCPDLPPRQGTRECDPFAEVSGCFADFACFPYVEYPVRPCGVEEFGTECRRAGSGRQGDSCEDTACAAQHLCVVTGRGTRCVKLCSIEEGRGCDPGLLCQPVDIHGVGGCFPP